MRTRLQPLDAVSLRPGTLSRAWPIGASIAIVLLFLGRNSRAFGLQPGVDWALAAALRLGIEAGANFAAARRRELPGRLRAALVLLGSICVGSALVGLLPIVGMLVPHLAVPYPVLKSWVLASYLLPIIAVLLIPMAPFRRGEWWTFLLDLTVSVGGFVAILWLMRTAQLVAEHPHDWFVQDAFFGLVSSAGTLIALNLLTLRRRAIPSRRAFWLFVTGLGAYLPASLIVGLWPDDPRALAWSDVFYFLTVVPTIWAAWAMRTDPLASPTEERPHWSRTLNPFAIASPALLAGALLAALRQGPASAVWPLAVTMAVLTALLVARLVLTAREHERSLRAIAEREAREQHVRLEALRRAAGGVAHVFNNSLMTVLGNAELGADARSPGEARDAFERIRASAQRSAALTRHLLWFTGQQYRDPERIALGTWLESLAPAIRQRAGHDIDVVVETRVAGARIEADREQLREVLDELVQNAVAALPKGGHLRVSAERSDDERADDDGVVRPLHLVVRDDGCGIAPQDLPHVFEPFFSSHDLADAPGLGLAIVHGVVLAHRGRIDVRSTPGAGTEVRIRLPEAGDD